MTNEQVQLNKDLLYYAKTITNKLFQKRNRAWFSFTRRRYERRIEILQELIKTIEYQLGGELGGAIS